MNCHGSCDFHCVMPYVKLTAPVANTKAINPRDSRDMPFIRESPCPERLHGVFQTLSSQMLWLNCLFSITWMDIPLPGSSRRVRQNVAFAGEVDPRQTFCPTA